MMNNAAMLGMPQNTIYVASSENSVNNVSAFYYNSSQVINTAAVKTYAVQVRAIRSF
jgi:hypothetical protein